MSKLERLIIAINYTLRELKLSSSEMQMARLAKERIEAWKGSFKVKKSCHAMEKAVHDAAEERDVSEDIQRLHHVLSSKRAKRDLLQLWEQTTSVQKSKISLPHACS